MIRADPTHLRKAMDLMLRLYEIDPDMQLTEILVFLHVAIKNGDEAQISTGDFASIFGMTCILATTPSAACIPPETQIKPTLSPVQFDVDAISD